MSSSQETSQAAGEAPVDVSNSSAPVMEEAPEEPFFGETFTISQALMQTLLGMGFSENAIKKSIAAGCVNEDTCVQWISMHAGHPELDTPLAADVRVIVKQKVILTEEQRAAKAAELKEKIRLTKEKEEKAAKEAQLKAELARIQTGKLMLEAKEQREAQQRANVFADMKKEKEADARAREKALLHVAIDKLVRQGMSLEQATAKATQEQEEKKQRLKEETAAKLAELQKQKQGPAAQLSEGARKSEWNLAAVVGGGQQLPPAAFHDELCRSSVEEPTAVALAAQVALIRGCPDAGKSAECISTLSVIVRNIIQSPLDLQKRSLKATNTVFLKKIAVVPGAVTFLRICGFSVAADASGQQLLIMNSLVMRVLYRALAALDAAS
jgi:hypothetical protein